MTNFEKYSKDMDTTIFAVVKGKPVDCDATVPCNECDLFCKDGILACVIRRMEWLKSEYEEPKINIPEDTPIDTRVFVSVNGKYWAKRHYAGFKDGKHYVWASGKTSWTCDPDEIIQWEYMKLYE